VRTVAFAKSPQTALRQPGTLPITKQDAVPESGLDARVRRAFPPIERKEKTVLNTAPTTTILPVKDMNRARSFYEKTLGLKPLGFAADGNFMFACAGRSTIALIPKPQGTKAEHTALSFEVEDVVKEIKELKQRGVVFEDYDLPGFKTVEHVCVVGSDKAAWFKDPEGNILCVHETKS
jgi:catechol 2,3-dioxygenase-like lactoylglutathione lyase family enzyme